jgi:VWFA-related protein
MALRFASFALVLTVAVAAQDSAAGAAQSSAPNLTVNARLVVLDVVVTDKSGKPVDGLTAQDFHVYEDGQLEPIRSFEPPSEHTTPAPPDGTALEGDDASSAATLDPAHPAAFGLGPVTVLVLDQLNTHFADSSFARRELRDYLAKQPALLPHPTSLLTVYDNNFKQLEGFTRSRDALLHALEAAPTKYDWKLEESGKSNDGPAFRLSQTLRALEQIAESYAPIRGRKNLIWVGGGFPTLDPTVLEGKDAAEVHDDLEHVTNRLLATRVTLYAVDPTSTAAGMTEITDSSQLAFAQLAGNEVAGAGDPYGVNDDFDRLGPVTGGRVIRGMNNIAAQIGDSIELATHYYTLAYAPSSASQAATPYRKIRVVCLRPGLTVATRTGYFTESTAQEKSNATLSSDLATAAESSLPLRGLEVSAEPDAAGKRATGQPTGDTYIVHVGASLLTWTPAETGSATAHVAIMAVSLSPLGKPLQHTLHSATATARAGVNLHDPQLRAEFFFSARPAAKATTLRFIVRDMDTGRIGSFDLHLAK